MSTLRESGGMVGGSRLWRQQTAKKVNPSKAVKLYSALLTPTKPGLSAWLYSMMRRKDHH